MKNLINLYVYAAESVVLSYDKEILLEHAVDKTSIYYGAVIFEYENEEFGKCIGGMLTEK